MPQTIKDMVVRWYKELTKGDLRTLTTKAIMDSVWEAGLETLQKTGSGPNTVYETGYRTGSVVAHGNTWAIRHFCLKTRSNMEGIVVTPRLQELVFYDLLVLAARTLQLSFGFVAQFGITLPASIMNSLEMKIHDLVILRAAIQPQLELGRGWDFW